MFELRHALRRLLREGDWAIGLPRTARLEQLDREALAREAERLAAEGVQAAGRRGGRRSLAAAAAWRELARRTGDAEALARASSEASQACRRFAAARDDHAEALARLEVSRCALARVELFDDAAMTGDAGTGAEDAVRAGGPAGALAGAVAARLEAQRVLWSGDAAEARDAAGAFEGPIQSLESAGRRDEGARLAVVETRLARADFLRRMGARLKDEELVRAAFRDLGAAQEALEGVEAPLTSACAAIARAACQASLAEIAGDLARLARAIGALARSLESLSRDRSPADWAGGQMLLAGALGALGHATENATALRRALAACGRAASALEGSPSHLTRAEATAVRGGLLERLVEITGDGRVLEAAEQAFKAALRSLPRPPDPAAWGLLQVQLGQVYAARLQLRRRDRGGRARAALAFQAALEVFEEGGLRALANVAAGALQRLARTRVG